MATAPQLRILHIDDAYGKPETDADHVLLRRVKTALENSNCLVETADDVFSAINLVQVKKYDFVILDLVKGKDPSEMAFAEILDFLPDRAGRPRVLVLSAFLGDCNDELRERLKNETEKTCVKGKSHELVDLILSGSSPAASPASDTDLADPHQRGRKDPAEGTMNTDVEHTVAPEPRVRDPENLKRPGETKMKKASEHVPYTVWAPRWSLWAVLCVLTGILVTVLGLAWQASAVVTEIRTWKSQASLMLTEMKEERALVKEHNEKVLGELADMRKENQQMMAKFDVVLTEMGRNSQRTDSLLKDLHLLSDAYSKIAERMGAAKQ